MSFDEMNANRYLFAKEDYNNEFQRILSKIILCYYLMLANKVKLVNDENKIRDYILKNYLKKEQFKTEYELGSYYFEPESQENLGRVDIKILPVKPFINDDAYYIIECKRLDGINQNGTTGLNAKYISEGMCRFVSQKYSSYFGVNGMIGFVVQSIDINKNVSTINQHLRTNFRQANSVQGLKYFAIDPNFKFSYNSIHSINEGNKIILYHLMFDFSKNIQQSSKKSNKDNPSL